MSNRELIVSHDVAQHIDYAAVVVLEFTGFDNAHLPMADVIAIQRWQGVAYPVMANKIVAIHDRLLPRGNIVHALDVGGIGAGMHDLYNRARLPVLGIRTHAGDNVTIDSHRRIYGVPKTQLLQALDGAFQSERVRLPANHNLTGTLLDEIKSLRAELTQTGKLKYEATDPRKGINDDLVVALAQSVWLAQTLWTPSRMRRFESIDKSVQAPDYSHLLTEEDAKDNFAGASFTPTDEDIGEAHQIVQRR